MKIKSILKKYSLILIACLIILGIFLKNLNDMKRNEQIGIQNELNWRATCLDNPNNSEEIMKLCREAQNHPIVHYDFFTYFSLIAYMSKLNIFILLIIIISVLYFLIKEFKNRVSLNYLSRIKYSSYIKKIIKDSYKYLLFFPLLFLIIIFLCVLTSKGFKLDISLLGGTLWKENSLNKPIIFIICYLLNLIFHLGLYINIALCLARKNHNFFTSLILTLFTILAIELFLEIFINAIIFNKIFHSSFGYMFNIMNWLIFPDNYGIYITVVMSFSFYILSCLVLYLCYKNKEKFIHDLEKNN